MTTEPGGKIRAVATRPRWWPRSAAAGAAPSAAAGTTGATGHATGPPATGPPGAGSPIDHGTLTAMRLSELAQAPWPGHGATPDAAVARAR